MASYLEKMRAPNVFGSNPFTPKRESPLGMLDQFINRLPRSQGLQQIGQMGQQPAQPGSINLIKPDTSKMDTVYAQMMSPAEQAKLEQRKAEQFGRERTAQAQIESREGIAAKNAEIQSMRAAAYDFKARNPGSKFMQGKDGILRAINPLTNETVELGATGLSEQEIATMNQENAVERIQEGGAQSRETQKLRGTQALKQIGARIAGQKEVKQTPSATVSPNAEKSQIQLNMNRLLNAKPELRKFVKPGPDGMPKVDPVGTPNFFGFTSGPTEAQRQELMNVIGTTKEEPKKEETKPTEESGKETPEQRLLRLKKAAGVD